MASFNKVILVGNLTRDPELRYTPQGKAIANFGIAVNHRWTTESGEKKEEVTFVDITLWGRTAENVGQYMRKGSSMLVEGRLKLDQWDDKQTGQKRQKLSVVGESVQFLGGSREEGGATERPASRQTATAPERRRAEPLPPLPTDLPPEEEDDVPF